MEANIQAKLTDKKITEMNRQIDELQESYIVKILVKLRKYLRKGPLNNTDEPYEGAFFTRGKITPFGSHRFLTHSNEVLLLPGDSFSYITGNTFFIPDHIHEMMMLIASKDQLPNSKLKSIYQTCVNAAANDSITRAPSTQFFYTNTLCRFIEIMADPNYRNIYTIINEPSFNAHNIVPTLSNNLMSGITNNSTNPYELESESGVKIEITPFNFVTIPKMVYLLLSEMKDPLRNHQQMLNRIYFRLIDAVISENPKRPDRMQQFYENLLNDFVLHIRERATASNVQDIRDLNMR